MKKTNGLKYGLTIYKEFPENAIEDWQFEDYAEDEKTLFELVKFYTSRGFYVMVANMAV